MLTNMNNHEWKVGQKVRRINDNHFGMKIGDTATIIEVFKTGKVLLDNYAGLHDMDNLELVSGDGWQQGDVLVNKGYETKILGVCGDAILLGGLTAHTKEEFADMGYSPLNETKEEVETIEIAGHKYSKKEVEEKLKDLEEIL